MNERRDLPTTHNNATTAARSPLPYLALLPVLAIVALAGYFAVRLAISPGSAATPAAAQPDATTDEALTTVAVLVERARQHLIDNRSERAEALLLTALQRFPREQELWLLYAETMMDLARPDQALASFETAIEIGPDHPEYRNAAGALSMQVGDPLTAEIHWSTGQKLDPTDPRFPFFLAQLQRDAGRTDEARANLMLVTRINPDLPDAWGTLASIAFDEGNYGPALRHLERARAIEPDRPLWRLIEARAIRRQGDPQRAAAVLGMIPDEHRLTDPMVLREMGLALGMLKQPEEAAETYLEALAYIAIQDDAAELIYDKDGSIVRDPRSSPAVRAELHHEAALWLERAADLRRALIHARRAADLGHPAAQATVDALLAAGADDIPPPPRIPTAEEPDAPPTPAEPS